MKIGSFQMATALIGFIFFLSCGTVRNNTPSAIGLRALPDYRSSTNYLPADTVYAVYQNDETFYRQFTPAATARRPGFGGQWVVAVLLPDTTLSPLQFERADRAGGFVNVYAQTCTSCSSGPALATVPKVGLVRQVRFFLNGKQQKVVTL